MNDKSSWRDYSIEDFKKDIHDPDLQLAILIGIVFSFILDHYLG